MTTVPNTASISSDESFAPLNDVDGRMDQHDAEASLARLLEENGSASSSYAHMLKDEPKSETTSTSVEDPETKLNQGLEDFRAENRQFISEEGEAADAFEERHSKLLGKGYRNARDWLANKPLLYRALADVGINLGKDDIALLGNIAKLQLGHWKELKGGKQVWSVESRRDERLARFYRIFHRNPETFPADKLEEVIKSYKGRSGGILKDDQKKNAPAKPTKKEVQANRKLARRAPVIAQVADKALVSLGNIGSYQLAIVRVTSDGLDICSVVQDDSLKERLVDKWAAKAALEVDNEEESEAAE